MKYLHLVWAGIWRRPGRATLTLLSIVNAFLLYGLLQGFVSGHRADRGRHPRRRADHRQPDQPAGAAADVAAAADPRDAGREERDASHRLPRRLSHVDAPGINIRGFAVDPDSVRRHQPDETIPPADLAALKRSRTGVILPASVAALSSA